MKIPYTRVVKGNRYFEPNAAMRRAGFRPLALGEDNEAARRRALDLYERWTRARTAAPGTTPAGAGKDAICAAKTYPPGSIGEAWQRWIASPEWAAMAPSTRNKIWWEAWLKRIEPVFGDLHPDYVTMDELSKWRVKIEQASGRDPAHKALKVWRAFWRVMRAMRYTQLSDPSEKIRNRAPPARDQRFSHREAMHLAKTAWRQGYKGLACIIVVAWDTGFAPVDCRTLRAKHRKIDPATGRIVLDRSQEGRTKTGVASIGTLSRFADHLIRRYFETLGAQLTAEAFLFRMRGGTPYGESRLGNDFATIREIALPNDKRQLRDMRRSAVIEAFQGGAGATAIAQKFSNTIDRSNVLFRTYNPVDLEQVKSADKWRAIGRRKRTNAEPMSEFSDFSEAPKPEQNK